MRHRLHTTRALLLAALLFAGSPALAQTNATAGQDAPPSTTAGATNNATNNATNGTARQATATQTTGATPKAEPKRKNKQPKKTAAAKETTIPGGALAFAAYLILWLLLFGVVASTLMQQRALVSELKDLERKMDDAFGLSDDT